MMATTAPILSAQTFDETFASCQKIDFKDTGRCPAHCLIVGRETVEQHFFDRPKINPQGTLLRIGQFI